MYRHKYYGAQSECIKYRGNTDQIDVTDTILAILAKYPGLTFTQIADKIYPRELSLSRGYVSKRLNQLASELREGDEVPAIVSDGKNYYLWNDAWSHDIGKTRSMMDRLNKIGVTPEMAVFLSSGLLMHAEEVKAESEGHNFNIHESAAAAPFVYVEPKREPQPEIVEEVANDIAPQMIEESDEVDANPFEGISEEDRTRGRAEVVAEILTKRKEDEERAEAERLQKIKDEEEKQKADEAARKAAEYKNVLKSIKSAKDLLGKEVQINPPKSGEESKTEVVGTILEIKPDGVDFLILYSNDPDVVEGTVKNYTYSQGLTYKILV